jgi:hypothetical protein
LANSHKEYGAIHKENLSVDESLLQGLHRPGIRLSVEEIVQRNKLKKGKPKRESNLNIQGRKSLESSLNINDYEIHSLKKAKNSKLVDLVKLHGR